MDSSSMEKYTGKGQELYEEWMDYKQKISRPPSTLSKESLSLKKKAKFIFSNDYATESQINSTRSSTKVKDDDEPFKNHPKAQEHKKKSAEKQIIDEIKSEFAIYYKWVTNGKNDDLSENNIKNILFSK